MILQMLIMMFARVKLLDAVFTGLDGAVDLLTS